MMWNVFSCLMLTSRILIHLWHQLQISEPLCSHHTRSVQWDLAQLDPHRTLKALNKDAVAKLLPRPPPLSLRYTFALSEPYTVCKWLWDHVDSIPRGGQWPCGLPQAKNKRISWCLENKIQCEHDLHLISSLPLRPVDTDIFFPSWT